MTVENVAAPTGCGPNEPAPNPTTPDPGDNEPMNCTGELHGTVSLRCECHCKCLKTRTFVLQTGPLAEPDLVAYLQTTVDNYENAGYLVLGHSLVDTGAGWVLALSVGWYA